MPQVKSQKTVFLQEAWRQAYRRGLVEIDLSVAAGQKQRLRMMLYNAVKLAKQNLDEDPELNIASQEVEIVNGADPTKLYMRKIVDSPAMKALANAIGTTMEEVEDPAIRESREKVQRMMKELDEKDEKAQGKVGAEFGKIGHLANPFYPKRG